MEEKENGFKIVDKRKGPEEEAPKESSEQHKEKKEDEGNQRQTFHLTFDKYVLQLANQAFISLGLLMDPVTNKAQKDITSAKYIIDLLEILEKKTKGNLTDNEDKVIKEVLYNLRMNYVQAIKT